MATKLPATVVTGFLGAGKTSPIRQSGFAASTALPVALSCALLVAAAPARPSERGLAVEHVGPDAVPEQAAQLRDGERQELGGQIQRELLPRP